MYILFSPYHFVENTTGLTCEPVHETSISVVYAQSDQSLCLSLEYSMSVKLLTEYHLEFLSLKGGCTGSPEATLVKIPHCLKSHDKAHVVFGFPCCLVCGACLARSHEYLVAQVLFSVSYRPF